MGSELTKWLPKVIKLSAVIAFCFILVSLSQNFRWAKYPYETESTWVCTDPNITISNHFDEHHIPNPDATVIWNGQTIKIKVGFQSVLFEVFEADENIGTNYLFKGTWHYRFGKLVFKIEKDKFFDGQYKELVFTRQELESPKSP